MESSPLIQSTYNAAVTLLLGNCDYRDSFGPVECFGARIKHAEIVPALMSVLVRTDMQLQMSALKDLNVLLLRGSNEDSNGIKMASAGHGKWSVWVTPVVMNIPAELSLRSTEDSERLKYIMNLFFQLIMVHPCLGLG